MEEMRHRGVASRSGHPLGEWQQGREGAVVVQAREGLLHKQPGLRLGRASIGKDHSVFHGKGSV